MLDFNENISFETVKKGISFDNIPNNIRYSKILTSNDFDKLLTIEYLPSESEVMDFKNTEIIQNIYDQAIYGCAFLDNLLHVEAQRLLKENQIKEAWLVLLQK